MVHQYKLNGYNIVLDTCSGSVHAVDDVAYDIIEMYKSTSEEKIIEAILKKYADMPDVTREDILLCISDIKELEKSGKLYFVDIPLFFESGGRAKYDFATSLLVYAPKELCLKRILRRDNANKTSANARINSQMDIEKKRALADFVLENTSDLASLEHGLKAIIEQIKTKMSLPEA